MKNFLRIFLIVMIPVASAQTASEPSQPPTPMPGPSAPGSPTPADAPAPATPVAPPPASGNTVVVPPVSGDAVPAATTTEPVVLEAPKRYRALPTGDIRGCLRFEDAAKVIACAERPGRYL